MMEFEVKYDKNNGRCLTNCCFTWEPSWLFDAFKIFAINKKNNEKIFLKEVLKRGGSNNYKEIDVSRLKPSEEKYHFVVCYTDQSCQQRQFSDSEISGDTCFEIPYKVQIYYFIENFEKDWHRVYVLVDGELPQDSLMVPRGAESYFLPVTPPSGTIYAFRFRASSSELIEPKVLVKITGQIQRVNSLKQLQENLK